MKNNKVLITNVVVLFILLTILICIIENNRRERCESFWDVQTGIKELDIDLCKRGIMMEGDE